MKDVNGNELDVLWMAEFRGFFFGEGYLGITRNGLSRGRVAYTARVQITVRDDDLSMLEDIQLKLGGSLHRETRGRKSMFDEKSYQTKPYVAWRVRSREDVSRVCDILEMGLMPSKKMMEIALLREFLMTVGVQKPGKKVGNEQRLFDEVMSRREELAEKIRRLHSYK